MEATVLILKYKKLCTCVVCMSFFIYNWQKVCRDRLQILSPQTKLPVLTWCKSTLAFTLNVFFRYLSAGKSNSNGDVDYDIEKKEVSVANSFKRLSGWISQKAPERIWMLVRLFFSNFNKKNQTLFFKFKPTTKWSMLPVPQFPQRGKKVNRTLYIFYPFFALF